MSTNMLSISKIVQKIIGSKNDRRLKSLQPIVQKINHLEPLYSKLSDKDLIEKTQYFKEKISNGANLDDLLPDAFATCREAAQRVLGMRHYDVQLIGGIALHRGWIAEARTGEGKTLMATLPSYLNALTENGVHIIVPNAYLAKRDANTVGNVLRFLGLSVDVADNDQSFEERQTAYQADVTYTTNHTLGFDYLRDNMRQNNSDRCMRGLAYCIIDEADSILIDEARTPLIITGPIEDSSKLYQQIYQLIQPLTVSDPDAEHEGDLTVLHKERQVHFTESGHDHINQILLKNELIPANSDLYDVHNIKMTHYINACLKGKFLYQKDVDYVVEKNQVVIIDESTGRKSIGRRWSDGLHQAIEAKENVAIQKENQTMASITYQNLFRLYTKISGMTGTADTEATELHDIYGLDVLVIPTNKPMIREDLADQVFLTEQDKVEAILDEVQKRHQLGQPLLIGTASIESSEYLSQVLHSKKIKHSVLNAKHHEKEADIIARAGCISAVTIATNMAGRGTDIILGGHPDQIENWTEAHAKVLQTGGLHVIGSERHESRRIDNQLRGRSGRQGDPGSTQFYLSLDDRLMKRFASDQVRNLMRKLGMKKGERLSASMLNRSIENAQRNIEGHYYDMRKNLLQLDNVANDQRSIIYQQRNELLAAEHISDVIDDMVPKVCHNIVKTIQRASSELGEAELRRIEELINIQFKTAVTLDDQTSFETLGSQLEKALHAKIAEQRTALADNYPSLEKRCLLAGLDKNWKENLAAMDHLRSGIHLRSYAQKNPTHEFKKDALAIFERMLEELKYTTLTLFSSLQLQTPQKPKQSGGYAITFNSKQQNHESKTH
ncbi:preprotein translocase subunit SecA [Candidatus Comchoanobacter bicostacola]|uniref:Protein translocase subunit SecA n=1 Tax=Candidatus Comchoanobacter bicostacola TaxID=2919598 RepID=A0ABY5DLN0_9GAMM|nr:preprotein translocase subunit SecA [Candidatus Comchoanobacter bicostacola]UTC24686.1 preprotein translocase subunit SecA [Candidatus Comchoanobacter bicostacola]